MAEKPRNYQIGYILDNRQNLFSSQSANLIWSNAEVKFLAQFAPDIVEEINLKTGAKYPVNEDARISRALSIARVVAYTTDNTQFQGKLKDDITRSKVKNIAKAQTLLGLPALDVLAVTPENYEDFSYFAKRNALDILHQYSFDKELISLDTIDFNHKSDIQRIIGPSLEGLVLYGSSVSGNGKDFDLLAYVSEYNREIFARIQNQANTVIGATKPIGMKVMPSYLRAKVADATELELRSNTGSRVIIGAPTQAVLSEEESIADSLQKAAGELQTLRGTIATDEMLLKFDGGQNRGLLEYFLKLELWINKALQQKRESRILTKNDVNCPGMLTREQIEKLHSLDDIREALVMANSRVQHNLDN